MFGIIACWRRLHGIFASLPRLCIAVHFANLPDACYLVTGSKVTLKKLKSGERYQIMIRSKNAAGYSKWSKVKRSKKIK